MDRPLFPPGANPSRAVRHHSARARAQHLRRLPAPAGAGRQRRERLHAGLPARGRRLPRRARRRHGVGQPVERGRERLLPDRRRSLDRAGGRRRLRNRHRLGVGQAGSEHARSGVRRAGPAYAPGDPQGSDGGLLMSLFGGLDISASALTAQRLRMDVTAENLANAQTTKGADGQPYRRKEVVLQEIPQSGGFGSQLSTAMGGGGGASGGVEVAGIAQDSTAGKLVYDPSNPDANAQGYVQMPNVDTVTEMTDLIDAQRAYEANVTAMNATKQMFTKTLDLLR